jgi:Dna[CI] antecedent DciA-like protein
MPLTRAGAPDVASRLFGGSPERVRALMQAAWPRAVGAELARRTEILGIEKGLLRVRVPDARWRTVLHRMQPDILRRLREIAGRLAPWRIGFVEGGIQEPPAVTLPRPQDEPPPAPPEVTLPAAAIADDEIRRRFLATAGRYLHRKDRNHA